METEIKVLIMNHNDINIQQFNFLCLWLKQSLAPSYLYSYFKPLCNVRKSEEDFSYDNAKE